MIICYVGWAWGISHEGHWRGITWHTGWEWAIGMQAVHGPCLTMGIDGTWAMSHGGH